MWSAGLISQGAGATALYPHADGMGSVRLFTTNLGTVAGSSQYDAFGAKRSPTGTQLPFGYTGEQQDAESGLVYLRAEYLEPQAGRFCGRWQGCTVARRSAQPVAATMVSTVAGFLTKIVSISSSLMPLRRITGTTLVRMWA